MPSTTSDPWSFNLRSTKTNHDSDSESDSNDDSNYTTTISEETRLLQDLDISHREETVVYKPNPFSLAKINAAARRSHAPPAPAPTRSTKPAPKKPTGRIVDSFKKAAEQKKSSNPATKSKAKAQSPNANTIPPSTKALVVPLHTATLSMPRIDKPDPTPRISPLATQNSRAILPRAGNEIDAPISTSFARSSPPKRLPSPPKVPPPRVRGPMIPNSHPSNASPFAFNGVPAHISTASPKRVVKKFRPPAPISFSSPLKPSSLELRGSAIANPTFKAPAFYSSPLRPPQSAFAMNASLAQPRYPYGKSSQPSQMHATTAYQSHSTDIPRLEPALQIPSNSTTAGGYRHMLVAPSTSTLHSESFESVPSFQPFDFRRTSRLAEISPSQCNPSVMTASVYRPSQSRDACRQHDLNLPPSSPIPSIPSPDPTPSPSPRRKRETATKLLPPKSARPLKRQTSDAYDYFRSDPDDEWSTLPSRKKAKAAELAKPRINGIKTSGTFRLPGTATKGKVLGISATSERRVITFLPPPLSTGKVQVLVEDAEPRSEGEAQPDVDVTPARAPKHRLESPGSNGTPKRRRLSGNPYPSPATSRLTPGDVTTPDVTVHSRIPPSPTRVRSSAHRFPSPPTSDPVPVPEHDSQMNATVTMDAVSQRYPQTKSLMRQRKRGADGVWNLLELPSCGIVHTDDESRSPSRELPVVVWKRQ
ncbi:hypothetical protein DFH08DRAFT_1074514 [Mycena albidolilacea]|uniref:Uncharacterized protein n=1 Tax=Mycena albidolilacea TaxID=1033008 RepID=A0AAD7AKP6_9AGAR|nr:hypothetical protein DFH08DRAFT_1074514 [Mycena albidolilacea]